MFIFLASSFWWRRGWCIPASAARFLDTRGYTGSPALELICQYSLVSSPGVQVPWWYCWSETQVSVSSGAPEITSSTICFLLEWHRLSFVPRTHTHILSVTLSARIPLWTLCVSICLSFYALLIPFLSFLSFILLALSLPLFCSFIYHSSIQSCLIQQSAQEHKTSHSWTSLTNSVGDVTVEIKKKSNVVLLLYL